MFNHNILYRNNNLFSIKNNSNMEMRINYVLKNNKFNNKYMNSRNNKLNNKIFKRMSIISIQSLKNHNNKNKMKNMIKIKIEIENYLKFISGIILNKLNLHFFIYYNLY